MLSQSFITHRFINGGSMLRHKISYNSIIHEYFYSESQIHQLIKMGKLCPDNWENMSDLTRSERLRDKNLLFSKVELEILQKEIAAGYLSNHLIHDELYHIREFMATINVSLLRLQSNFNEVMEPMSLKEIATLFDYKPQTLLNYIRKWIKTNIPNYKKKQITEARLPLPGMLIPVYLQKGKWRAERFEVLRQKRGLKFNDWNEINKS